MWSSLEMSRFQTPATGGTGDGGFLSSLTCTGLGALEDVGGAGPPSSQRPDRAS